MNRASCQSPKPFLGIQFVSCNAYGRLYKTPDGSAYAGRCPRCGRTYSVRVGAGGTANRFFQARCH